MWPKFLQRHVGVVTGYSFFKSIRASRPSFCRDISEWLDVLQVHEVSFYTSM